MTNPMDRLDAILAPALLPLLALIPAYFAFQVVRALVGWF